jgi:ribose/xylose/arabinose/galactoside ABC-type transport system permease subunit
MRDIATEKIPETGKVAGTPDGEPRSAAHTRWVHRTLFESSVTTFVFILLVAGFGIWLGGTFLNVDGLLLNVHQNVPILVLSLSALVTVTTGLFDLSIAGIATLTVMSTIALTVKQGLPLPLALIISEALGITVGLINAFLVERLRVTAFIATLGTGGIAAGIADVYAGGVVISPGNGGHPIPSWFTSFGNFTYKAPGWLILLFVLAIGAMLFLNADRLRPLSWTRNQWLTAKVALVVLIVVPIVSVFPVWRWMSAVSWMIVVLLVVAVMLWVLMEHTTFGRHLQAIGSNRSAALLTGVKVRRQITKTFVLAGAISAFAGVCLAATTGSAEPDAATSFLLPAFASVFLSTVVLSHGKYTVPGTVFAGIFVVWIGLGLVIGGVPADAIPVFNGAILIGAVALSTAVRRSER